MSITAYISVADADTYLAEVPFTVAWDALSDADKTKYLMAAQRAIDRLPLRGYKYQTSNEGQEEEWPRIIDGVTIHWNSTTGVSEIPQAVQDAVCEEVRSLASRGDPTRSPRLEAQDQGVAEIKLPDGMMEKYVGGNGTYRNLGLYSMEAYWLLQRYISNSVFIR